MELLQADGSGWREGSLSDTYILCGCESTIPHCWEWVWDP